MVFAEEVRMMKKKNRKKYIQERISWHSQSESQAEGSPRAWQRTDQNILAASQIDMDVCVFQQFLKCLFIAFRQSSFLSCLGTNKFQSFQFDNKAF